VNDNPLEKVIERKAREAAAARGIGFYKFTSPARAGVPDRLLLATVPGLLMPVLAQYICFAEFKRKGKLPTPVQIREIARLRALGYRVEILDSVEQSLAIVESMG